MYQKGSWLDRVVQFPRRYSKSGETSGQVTLTPDPGTVTQEGTPITATRMSNIEQGIADAHNVGPKQSVTIKRGLNVLQCGVPGCPLNAVIYGRTLANLLGKDGNCEDTSKWSAFQITPTLDSANAAYGSNAFKVTLTGSGGSLYQNVLSLLNAGKYYIALADVKNGNAANVRFGIDFSTAGAGLRFGPTVTTAAWKSGYVKVDPSTFATSTYVNLFAEVNGVAGQYAFVDGFRLYEVDAATYAKIDVDPEYTGDKLAEKFPYVDGIKHLYGPALQKMGKNLIPPFTEWTLHANSQVTEPYKLTHNASVLNEGNSVFVPALPNTTYTVSIAGSNGRFRVWTQDASGANIVNRDINGSGSLTFTTESNCARLWIVTLAPGPGLLTFDRPQLELGSAATTFEPRNDDYAFLPVTLASSIDGSVRDAVFWRDGWRKLKRWQTDIVLDGSYGWTFSNDWTGFKRVHAGTSFAQDAFKSTGPIATKYDGRPLSRSTTDETNTSADRVFISSTPALTISIADSDSGWTESLNPTANAIKALMNGWKANGNNGTVYNSWVSVLDGSAPGTNTEAYVAANKAPGWTGWATLSYQLAAAVEEIIPGAEGSIGLQQGGNQVELFEGVVVREKANPKADSTNYCIGIDGTKYPSITGTETKFRTEKIIKVYKNGIADNGWKVFRAPIGDSSDIGYGREYVYLPRALFDPTAEYTVTYVMLDKYASTVNAVDATGEVETTPAGSVAANARDLADVKTGLGALWNRVVSLLRPSALLDMIKTVDGAGSGLDADLFDGADSSLFSRDRGGLSSISDWNTLSTPGTYQVSNGGGSNGPGIGNGLIVEVATGNISGSAYIIQRATSVTTFAQSWRVRWDSGSWQAWQTSWNTSILRWNAGVLEYNNGGTWTPVSGVKSVQRGSAAILRSANQSSTVTNITISAVNMSKAWVNIPWFSSPVAGRNVNVKLTSSTNVEVTHYHENSASTADSLTVLNWEVVESN